MIAALESLLDIPGFMEIDELEWLYNCAAECDSVLEIGCWYGRSASALALGCQGHVWTVDHFKGSPSELDGAHRDALLIDVGREAELLLDQYENISILRKTSLEASRLFLDQSLDMVFLDGDHEREAVLIDLISWRPKVRKLICGHDRNWEGVYGALAIYGMPFDLGPGSIWYTEMIDGR